MKIRTKFSIASGIVVFIIISFLAFSTYFLVKETLEEKNNAYIKDNATLLSSSISNWLVGKKSQIGVVQEELEKNFTIENFQYQLENDSLTTDFSLMFGTIATERGLRSNNPNRVNPPEIDFRERDWYKLGATKSGVSFTAPYVDAATKELLLSVVAPINVGGQLRGVIGGDLSLGEIAKSVNTINFNGTGEAFIVDASNNIITHQDTSLNGKSTTEVYRESPKQVNQLIDIEHNGSDKILYFTQLDETSGLDWYIGVILDKDLVYQSLSTFTKTTIVFTFFSIALCVFALRKLAKHLLSPLAALEDAITEVASGDGDLTQRLGIEGEDECTAVAAKFNEFLTSLQQLVQEITAKASNVLVSSSEVNTLSKGSTEQLSQQFSQIDGLATAMHEMSTTSADIAASAQEAASLVTSVSDNADASRDLFDQTAKDVVSLCDSISLSLELSNQLAEYSNNIEKILSVINGIAEQTNLLALNAAIEAARAGEQGRGFAVVADEVRSLASRTQESTTEIKSMIDHIQNYSSRVQSSMNESQSNAEECVKHTEVANQSLESINNSVKEIMDRNIQIATAIEEQSVVIEEVNRTTINIKDISVQVDEFAGKQYECSNELVSDVEMQQKLLDKFIV